jgi:ankyrin repeat protein
MAVAQNHHEGHSKMVHQMQQSKSSPNISVNAPLSSSRPPICRLNKGKTDNPPEACTTPTQSSASKASQSNDSVDATPPSTVRTSTLRRLFSGIADTPVQSKVSPADSAVAKQARSKVSCMREMFEQSRTNNVKSKSPPDPIASVFGNKTRFSTDYRCGNSSDQINSVEISTASVGRFGQGRSSPSFLARVRDAFAVDDSKQHEDSIHLPSLSDTKSPGPDPPDCVDENIRSSMSVTLQNLDVTNLVRQSLSQKEGRSVIDTDGTATDITGGYDEEHYLDKMGSLLMSPALLTKRYLQALEAIELRNWEQVSYLINADPWLMEMKDLRNDQYLVHVLALFGAGQYDSEDDTSQPAPEELIEAMLEHDPSVTHKLDSEGNLPLHMAAASGNIAMIRELGLRFPSAASVQNHDGFLPLHLAIMSCALFPTGEQAVSLILALFDGGVCVKDNGGNMPLHTAARTLKGDVGVDIIYQLMAVCNKLAHDNPVHLRESIGGNVKKPKQLLMTQRP